MPAVELHDPLLYLLLIRQEFVHAQKVHVCYIIIVTNFRYGGRQQKHKYI